jgi:hypothetical protein
MERDEDGVVLGSTRLLGSQRLHQSGDATRAAESPVEPMTAASSSLSIPVSSNQSSDYGMQNGE